MRTIACLAVALLTLGRPGPAGAQTLSAQQQALLEQIDAPLASDLVALAARIDEYRKAVEAVKKSADAAAGAGAEKLAELRGAKSSVEALLKVAAGLRRASPAVRKLLAYEEKLAGLTRKVEEAKKLATERDISGLEKNEAAAEVKKEVEALRAYLKEAANLGEAVRKQSLDRIKLYSDPAKVVRSFVQDRLQREFIDRPYKAGSFEFKLARQEYNAPVFSPKANLALVLTYKGGIEAKATGLYFKYNATGLPEPRFDRVKVEPGAALNAALSKGLSALGDELPSLGMPIKVRDIKAEAFTGSGTSLKGGRVSATVEIQLAKLADVGLGKLPNIAGDVTLSLDGKVEVGALALKDIKLTPPVALGTSGLFIESVHGKLAPRSKDKAVTLGIVVSTAAGGSSTMHAVLDLSFGFPVTRSGVTATGTLKVNTFDLGKVEAKLTREKLHVTLLSDIPGLGKLKAEGDLTKEGLDARGTMSQFFGASNVECRLFLRTNGHGTFAVTERVGIGGTARAEVSLQGSHTPGFKNVTFTGALRAEVGNEYLGRATASVDLDAQAQRRPRIKGTGHVGAFDVAFEVNEFGLILKELENALREKREQLFKYLADRERAASNYLADREESLKKWIYQNAKNAGLDRVSTGNPTIDKALGDASKGLKDAGGAISGGLKDVGGAISSGLGGMFGRKSSPPPPPPPDPKEEQRKRDAAQRAALEQQLAGLLAALPKASVSRSKHPKRGEVADLAVRVYKPVVSPRPGGNAEVSFLVQVSSFRYELDPKNPRKGAVPRRDNFYIGSVALKGLRAGGAVKADVSLPRLENVSPWDAAALLRDELLDRLQAHLKGVKLAGRFEERMLALHNNTKETIVVWCQLESKVGAWVWKPAGPGPGKQATRVTVPSGKTVTTGLHGRRARLWAESDSGLLWTGNMKLDLALVREKDDDGDNRYYAPEMGTFRFTFNAGPQKEHPINERLVAVRNDTAMPLLVRASARSKDLDGKAEWERTPKPVRVEPGRTVTLRDEDGLRLRGDAVRFIAEDDKKEVYRWARTGKTSTELAEKGGYRASSMGRMVLVLEPPGKSRSASSAGAGSGRDVLRHFAADQAALPSVKGKSLADARKALADRGFKVAPTSGATDARVKASVPESGWHPLAEPVRLTLDVPAGVEVPNFVGKTSEEATDAAKRLGLVVRSKGATTTRPTKNRTLVGKVVVDRQTPSPGRRVDRGTTVEVELVRYTAATPPLVEVPKLLNKTRTQAEDAAKAAGLKVTVAGESRRETKDRTLLGKTLVDHQNPPAGHRVAPGSLVSLHLVRYVAESPPKAKVPAVNGRVLSAAAEEAKRAGLELNIARRLTRTTTDIAKVGTAIVEDQAPAAGSLVEKGSTVNVTLVTFKREEVPTVAVPNLRGKPLAEAEQLAKAAGLTVRAAGEATTRPTKDRVLFGKTLIDTQEPVAGRSVRKGATVEVKLVHYTRAETPPPPPPPPAMVRVPSLKGRTLEDAQAEGKRLGFRVQASTTTTRVTKDAALVGKTLVDSQSIAAGMSVARDAVVEVRLVRYQKGAPLRR